MEDNRDIQGYWMMVRPEYGLVIYGEEFEPLDFPEDLPLIRASKREGYLFGEWFSIACPEGELGSNHISRCLPITAEHFQQMKSRGWR